MKTRMKFKETMLVAIYSLCSLTLPIANAGDREGNGGGYILCRQNADNVKNVTSYDLWRAEHEGVLINGRKIKIKVDRHSRINGKEQALQAASKIRSFHSVFCIGDF